MMNSTSILKVLDVMSNNVFTVQSEKPASEAISILATNDVGSVVVLDSNKLAGIITKGDILREILLKGLRAQDVPVKKVMTKNVVTIDSNATVEDASKLMIEKKISKLPVMKGDALVGIITSTDIIRTEPMAIGYLQELVRARYVPHDLR
jgi:CBS domain-containing protein